MMRRWLLGFVLGLLMLPACAAQGGAQGGFQPAQLRNFQRSTLTIERRGGRDSFQVWLAQTDAEHQQGLMWVRELPRDYGMLFVLGAPRQMNMWMKNTYVSLDMLFVDTTGRITHIAHRTTPLSEAIVESGGDVSGVLELAGGEAQRRGIEVGSRIIHAAFQTRH